MLASGLSPVRGGIFVEPEQNKYLKAPSGAASSASGEQAAPSNKNMSLLTELDVLWNMVSTNISLLTELFAPCLIREMNAIILLLSDMKYC